MIASGAVSPAELTQISPIVPMIPVLTCECAWATPPAHACRPKPSRSRSPDTPLCPASSTRDSGGAEVNPGAKRQHGALSVLYVYLIFIGVIGILNLYQSGGRTSWPERIG